MIKKLFGNKLPSINAPIFTYFGSPSELTFKPNQPRSKAKSRSKRIKFYESKPHLFKKVAKLKIPDFSKPLLYPINIPIRYRYVYRPTKTLPKLSAHDFLNFKNMTGNEILLNLENAEHLRSGELVGALMELGLRKG